MHASTHTHTHTHTRTRTHTHARTHKHTHTGAQMNTPWHTHTPMNTHTQKQKPTSAAVSDPSPPADAPSATPPSFAPPRSAPAAASFSVTLPPTNHHHLPSGVTKAAWSSLCAAPSASRDLRRWDCETRDARSENGTRMVTVQVTRAGKTCGARRSDGASGTGARARDATWRCELLRCRPGLRHTSHGRVQANTWISCMAHMPAITPQTPARQVSAHAGLMRVRTTSVRVYVRARTLRKLELRRLRISQGKARGRGFPPRRHVCMRVRALRLRLRLCRATLALATGSSHPPSATPSHIRGETGS